jgi:hypothetical protein
MREPRPWREIVVQIEAEIEKLRSALEAHGMTPEKTEHFRGQIVALRKVITFAHPPITADDVRQYQSESPPSRYGF